MKQVPIFYENQDEIRIVGAHWELITYIPLNDYDLRHHQLELEIKKMDEHCKENLTDSEMCSKYYNVLKTTFNEISVQRKQMYVSIGRYLLNTVSMGEYTTIGSIRLKRINKCNRYGNENLIQSLRQGMCRGNFKTYNLNRKH
ncbi:Uncharacterized protein FWK35_00031006 [Aphis craccivora]|uniref:Uncharacterized protein n=1 Tax=Aphis craccivora TaxID=307492 RepID=A0A6G0VTU3_APHCR|nr:Uncharacterized protein FWK35_00031006 [Aphis craccivora]